MNADHFLFGASLNFSTVDCVVRAGTTKLFLSGLSEACVMEADTSGPLCYVLFVDSPDAKSQMAIHIQNGVSVRAAYKAMRKRVRVEARRQRELEEGRPPEVLLESCLELLKHKLRRPPELPKRVLTSAAKAAKHRRLRAGGLPAARSVSKATGALSSIRCRKCKDKMRARLVCHRPVWPQIVTETGRKYHYLVQLQSLFLDR